jgi:Zn-dependent protease
MLWFVAFLFSTTCHEAGHAWAAQLGGDKTAYYFGQVSLNPAPHIRREPFGMVLMPWLSYLFLTQGWMMGWASAPYDALWARRHPRRAAWMAAAGPAANFALLLVAVLAMHVGIAAGVFQLSGTHTLSRLVTSAAGGPAEGFATFLSILFSLNLILGTFNLLPVPPLDGFGVLGLFLTEDLTLKVMDLRDSLGGYLMLGILVAWWVFGKVLVPIFFFGVDYLLYLPYL